MQPVSHPHEDSRAARPGYGALLWLLVLAAGLGTSAALVAGLPRPPLERQQQEPRRRADQPREENEATQTNTGSEAQQPAESEQPDELMAGIRAAVESLSSPDLGALGQAFDTSVRKPGEARTDSAPVELIELGDLDGDGVTEVALRLWAGEANKEDAQAEPSPASWRGLYLLSWDGTRWKVSSLAATGEDSQFKVVRLGKNAALGLAVVNVLDGSLPYPTLYRVQDHEAALLWDSQAGDNRYNALARGRIEFRDDPKLDQTEMIVTGRADPGLLEFEPDGHRGFSARCVYHWDGEAYVPGHTEYAPGPDNSLYRFIAALHLRDFRSAYALIDPGRFLKTGAPSLEQFRRTIETSWPEFLDDQVFQAREAQAGAADELAFELPEKHYVYRPTLSNDGKFLLTGLERAVEAPSAGSAGDSP